MEGSILNNISLFLIRVFEVGLLAISLSYCLRRYNPRFLRILPLFAFVNVLADVYISLGHTTIAGLLLFDYIELIYFAIVFHFILQSRLPKIVIWIFTGILILACTWGVIKHPKFNFTRVFSLIEYIVLIYGSIAYFKSLIKVRYNIKFSEEPDYWFVLGIFFYAVISLPSLWLLDLYYSRKMMHTGDLFTLIYYLAQGVCYTFWFKAMRRAKGNWMMKYGS